MIYWYSNLIISILGSPGCVSGCAQSTVLSTSAITVVILNVQFNTTGIRDGRIRIVFYGNWFFSFFSILIIYSIEYNGYYADLSQMCFVIASLSVFLQYILIFSLKVFKYFTGLQRIHFDNFSIFLTRLYTGFIKWRFWPKAPSLGTKSN